jgi:predicted negative regulator of RcsB-dependent stress response
VSPKNKGKFGKAKSTSVPETDEFISTFDKIFRALKPHTTRLIMFFSVVALVVVGYAGWSWWHQRTLAHATAIYSRAVTLTHVPIRGADADGGAGQQKDQKKKKDERPPDPRGIPSEFASVEERSRAVLSALEELTDEYGDTDVGRQGLLLQGETLYQLGRYGDAAARYGEFAGGGGSDGMVLSAREGEAYALEAKALAEKDAKARQAGLEQALKAFQNMQPQGDGPRHDEALYHQARVQNELGQKDQARKTLERILTEHQDTPLKRDIEMRLSALTAK